MKGWQEDFLKEIGLEDLCEDNFKRLGGVNGVVLPAVPIFGLQIANVLIRTASISPQASQLVCSASVLLQRWVSHQALPSALV